MSVARATSGTTPVIYPSTATSPNPSYTGTFIPEIWSGKLIEKFYASTVLSAISNTDYEGEIKNQGDKIIIRTRPTITINDYKVDGTLALERPAASNVTLTIDNAKYFNEILDDIMDVQSDLNLLSMWADDAGQQLKLTIDTAILASMLHQAAATNRGTTAGKSSATINLGVSGTPLTVVARNATVGQVEIIDVILRLGQALDEQNIPEQGRWIVLPTWAATMIKQSELRQVYLSGDSVSILRNGRIGMIDRFTIYASNLMPAGVAGGLAAGENVFYAGHAHGLTFASQITKVETLRSEMTFGTILRGLQVYGSKVLDGSALAEAVVTH
jgi:hypothetical protein